MDTAEPIYYYSFCIRYVYLCGAFSSNEESPSCSLLDISHTPPILGKLKYSMDSSREYLLIALINTAAIQNVALVVAALQRALQRGKT